ncbi:alpha/beta fold hydrolase [Leucothrix mucor]|uniref:alpha/beta fold hydrolase n=1 Tax=Leucothrix mucor TaxID=45248 RepID=UPI0003B33A43|nr:alpha/beta hydrolase [Leucothrix mucor]
MDLQVNGIQTYAATGGKPFDNTLPTVLFLHGSGMDHRAWALQTRWFAFHGFSVLAPDFPGHSLSEGEPLESIEAMGAWLSDFMDAAGVSSAHVVGHSQGFLTALELAKQTPEKVTSLSGIGTAAAIPVNPALVETAEKSAAKAADMMLQWGFGPAAQYGISAVPGMQPIAIGRQIMSGNPLATDLKACANYSGGDEAAAALDIPSCLILAGKDKMTPLKAGQALAKILDAKVTVLPEYGHMLPVEAPKECLRALRDFIRA